MKKVYNFLFGYSKKKFTAIVILQFIGWIILSIIFEYNIQLLCEFFDSCFGLSDPEGAGIVTSIIFGIILGSINGFFINLILYVIELLESSASSLKVIKEKSESNNNNTDNT